MPTSDELVREVARFDGSNYWPTTGERELAQRLADALARERDLEGKLEAERLDNYSVRQSRADALAEVERLRAERNLRLASLADAEVEQLRQRAEAAEYNFRLEVDATRDLEAKLAEAQQREARALEWAASLVEPAAPTIAAVIRGGPRVDRDDNYDEWAERERRKM